MANQAIPTWKNRADIPEKYRWQLEDIYRSDDDWEAAFAAVPRLLEQVLAWRGRLAENSGNLLSALEQASRLDLELMELMAYARMRRDEDNAVSRYQDMADRATGLYYQTAAATAFLTPEIAALPENELRVWLGSESGLLKYRHQLENIQRNRPHILPEAEEALLAGFGPVADGIGDVFTMLNNVDIKLGSVDDGEGGKIELTHATFSLLREHRDREVRSAAFAQMHQAFASVGQTVAALYATQVKADILQAKARKHPDSLGAALFGDNLPSGVHSGLLEALHDGIDSLSRYLDLRRRCLELPDLHFYDAYVPFIAQPEKSYTFEEACSLLRKGLAPLGPRYLADLEQHLENRWIDVCETPGKTSGAYSWGSYRSHPYILLNWNGSLSDVFTLAHEIGHSMHTFYSNQRPFPQAHYPIFLAEIASTVNENLLMHALLAECDEQSEAGRQEKAFLLNHFLDEFRTTVHRQALFAEFEWQAHQKAEQGEALTAEWLCGQYGQLLQQYYGSQMMIDDYMRWEWARIPHFYSAFYVFKYATGFSAAVALSRQILSGQPGAADRYMRFLGAGGSDYPLAVMAATGLNMASRQPVDDALAEFSARLTQLSQLIDGRQGSWKPN